MFHLKSKQQDFNKSIQIHSSQIKVFSQETKQKGEFKNIQTKQKEKNEISRRESEEKQRENILQKHTQTLDCKETNQLPNM